MTTPAPYPVHVLVVEDRPEDADLMMAELRRSGYAPVWTRVETESEYLAALRPDLDVILADYALPQFSAPRALEILAERGIATPLIVVTGAVGEEHTVECVRKGAVDYIFKDRLKRLGLSVRHVLEERALRAEQRTSEAALRQSEAMFKTLVENVSDSLTLIDSNGIIRYQSPASERAVGYTERELIATSALAHIHPDDRAAVEAALERAMELPAAPVSIEYRYQTKDGTFRTLETVGKRLEVGAQVPMCILVSRDVTERRLLEAEFRQAQKMEAIGRLAGGIAHDFNNLLTAIIGFSEMLLADTGPNDPRRADLKEIEFAGQRAAALTRQLLSFSRRELSEPQVISLNDMIQETEGVLRRLIREDITLTTPTDPGLKPVWVDIGQIEQVLFNLVVNARDAMPKGGRLVISTANVTLHEDLRLRDTVLPPGDYVRLDVQDTGCGMTEEVKAHLFEPFFTTKPANEGTGLGLATAYGIVKQAGGAIDVTSAPGKGTAMTIYLPPFTGEEKPEIIQHGPVEVPGPGRCTETILVVEDEAGVRKLTCTVLRREGYNVIEASGPDEARQRADGLTGPLDLVLTDIILPDDSGIVLAEDLRKTRPDLKILFMSGYSQEAIDRDYGSLGAERLLKKPFRPNQLKAAVRAVLDEPKDDRVQVGGGRAEG